MIRLLRSGIGALAIGGLCTGVLSAPASAQPAPSVVLKLGPKASLNSTGKLVRVRANITCNNAGPAPISASVTQNRGSVTVHGSGTSAATYKCNGRTQHVVVPVAAATGTRFHTGGANATADVTI